MASETGVRQFIVDREKVSAVLDPDTCKMKYIRLLTGDDSSRNITTMVEFMAEISDWTERELGELTMAGTMALWDRVEAAMDDDAMDPTEGPKESSPSSPGVTNEEAKSPDGAAS